MVTMFAEVWQDDLWHKVGKEFKSTYEELDGQLTDRVYDGRDDKLISFIKSQSYYGMPSDVSADIQHHMFFQGDEVWYLSLKHLMDLEWDQDTYQFGYITEWQYKRLVKDGTKPEHVLKHLVGSESRVATPFFMDMVLEYPSIRKHNRYFVEYQYDKARMRDLFEFFTKVSIPALINLIPENGTMNDVRIVFSIT